MMEFNPYGSFLDFSRHDWSLGDDNDDHDHEDVKSSKGNQDSATKKQERPSSSPLPDALDNNREKEQQGLNGDLSRKKSIRSDPATAVTAASTASEEPFSFEISLPPGLDVSPLSCKESVVASMMSRSVSRALQVPPLEIRAGPTKSSRARSKSRIRKTTPDPPSSQEILERGPEESHGRSHSKERTRAHSSERRSKRRSRSRENPRPSKVDEPTPSQSKEHSKRSSSKERRALKSSRSRSMDPTSHELLFDEESALDRHRTSSHERRSRRGTRTEYTDPTSQAPTEETHIRSQSKERVKVASPSSTKLGPTERSKSIDPSSRSAGGSDHEPRRRTRSISMARTTQEDRSKRPQSKARVNALEEIVEHKSDHSGSRRGRKRSPSSSRHSSNSASVNPSSVESQSQEQNRGTTPSSRSRSKSRTRKHNATSPRILMNKSRSERNLTTVQELAPLTEAAEDILLPPPPPPPPPPSRHNSLSSPRRLGKDVGGRRSSRDLSPRAGSSRSSEDPKQTASPVSSPSLRRHKSIDGSNDRTDASPRSRSIGSRRRASRRSTDLAMSTSDLKRSHVSKWSELRQTNPIKRADDSNSKDSIMVKEVDSEQSDLAKQTKETNGVDHVFADSVTTSDSHQRDFAGIASPRRKLSRNHDGEKGLVDVQPKLQNVMIRPKQTDGALDPGMTDTHAKPPASPALSASRARKTIQNTSVNLNSPRGGWVANGKEKRESDDADSENGNTSKSPSLEATLRATKKAVISGKGSATGSRAGSESEGSQSLGSGIKSRQKDSNEFNNWQVSGTNELIGNFSTDTFLIDNDAILVAPKIAPVILHGNNTSTTTTTTTTSTNSLKKSSPIPTHKAIAKISEHSDSAASVERLKRASELIQAQQRKKEASRSRQKALEERSRSSLSIEQSPNQKRGADLVTSKSETAITSPRQQGWGLLKSMRVSSRLLTSGSMPPSVDLESNDPNAQSKDAVDADQSSKWTGRKGASEFVKASSTRVSSRRESRRRSQNEEGAEPRKQVSSKWKDLSRRLQTKDIAKPSKGEDPPEGNGPENDFIRDSPDMSPQRRLSKWTGLKGARAFIAGRHSEHHKLLLSDDGLM